MNDDVSADAIHFEHRGQTLTCWDESPGGIASIGPNGARAHPSNAQWWVRVDEGEEESAFDARAEDRDDEAALIGRLRRWYDERYLGTRE